MAAKGDVQHTIFPHELEELDYGSAMLELAKESDSLDSLKGQARKNEAENES